MQLKSNRAGFLVNCSTAGAEPFQAFVPNPLPPVPSLELNGEHFDRLERTNRALGKLDSLSRFLPDVSLFVYWFVRKEAVLSSQIEGTQSSLSDLLLYEQKETPGVPLEDVEEVSRYVAAVNHGVKRLREGFRLVFDCCEKSTKSYCRRDAAARNSRANFAARRTGSAALVPEMPALFRLRRKI
jgi:hypothetical protein